MNKRVSATARVLTVGIVCVVVVATLAQHEVHLWGLMRLRSAADIVHVHRLIPYTSGIVTLALAIAISRPLGRVIVLLPACILSAAIYVLSVRSVEVNGTSGEITEFWAGIVLKRTILSDRDTVAYCYGLGAFTVNVRSAQTEFDCFRGVWPATFSERKLAEAFAAVPRCKA
jgi:hypothetical protein